MQRAAQRDWMSWKHNDSPLALIFYSSTPHRSTCASPVHMPGVYVASLGYTFDALMKKLTWEKGDSPTSRISKHGFSLCTYSNCCQEYFQCFIRGKSDILPHTCSFDWEEHNSESVSCFRAIVCQIYSQIILHLEALPTKVDVPKPTSPLQTHGSRLVDVCLCFYSWVEASFYSIGLFCFWGEKEKSMKKSIIEESAV